MLSEGSTVTLPREAVEHWARFLREGPPTRTESVAVLLGRLARRRPVSIVIPIFNAARAVSRCLESLCEAHPIEAERPEIVLVDDHSSDPAIGELCDSFRHRWDNCTILKNRTNMGFVSSANRGMKAASANHDLVLLNSDTIVTRGWDRDLSVTAYLDDAIATVCPMSNAAGVFSVPVAYEDSEIPLGWTPAMCDRLLGFVSPRLREQVPATTGFCLFIKRATIDAIGYLDELLFTRGYGEDNDFCERAREAGLVHVVDDSRLVYHERSASFEGSKADLKRQNSRILKALHPQHTSSAKAWLQSSRLEETRAAYRRLFAVLNDCGDPASQPFFTTAPVSLEIKPALDAIGGEWSSETRRIEVLLNEGGRIEIDLFGERAALSAVPLLDHLFHVIDRWNVSIVRWDTRDDALSALVRPLVTSLSLVA